MGKVAPPQDVFMQFAVLDGVWPGVTTALTEAKLKTGLSIRGGLMWLVHMIEFVHLPPSLDDSDMNIALSTREDLAARPTLTDPGTLAVERLQMEILTSGGGIVVLPRPQHFLPPIPLAAPNLSMYFQTETDDGTLDGSLIECRLGYTTTPLDAKSYAEIAETWSYV